MNNPSFAAVVLFGLSVLPTESVAGASAAVGARATVVQRGGKQKAARPSSRQKLVQKRSSTSKKGAGSLPSTPAAGETGKTGGLLAPTPTAPGSRQDADGEVIPAGKVKEVPPTYRQASDEEIADWYRAADYDGNGWISFGEAAQAMSFDRVRFSVYDNDRDGRFQFPEFKLFYFDCLSRQGTFIEPKAKPEPPQPPPRDPEQLRNAYDSDLDEYVSQFELETILRDYQRSDLVAERVLAAEDDDTDGRLSISELEGLVALLYPVSMADTQTGSEQQDPAGSLLELFRRVVPRDSKHTGTPSPPLITGPVTHFSRLDLDDDGAISLEDLKNLLRPVPERVRLSSVLNSLDLDGDGVLNPGELERALMPRATR